MGNDIPKIFSEKLEVKQKKVEFCTNNYFKIKGKLDHFYFMNKLIYNIKEEFKEEKIFINANKNSYKVDIIFVANEDEENEKDCIIQLKLYQTGEDEYALRFLRKSGSLPQYYMKIMKFIELAKKSIIKYN